MSKDKDDEEEAARAMLATFLYMASLTEAEADEINRLLKACRKWEPEFMPARLRLPNKAGDYLVYAKYTSPDGEYDGEGWEIAAYSHADRKFLITESESEHIEILLWSALPDYRLI